MTRSEMLCSYLTLCSMSALLNQNEEEDDGETNGLLEEFASALGYGNPLGLPLEEAIAPALSELRDALEASRPVPEPAKSRFETLLD